MGSCLRKFESVLVTSQFGRFRYAESLMYVPGVPSVYLFVYDCRVEEGDQVTVFYESTGQSDWVDDDWLGEEDDDWMEE